MESVTRPVENRGRSLSQPPPSSNNSAARDVPPVHSRIQHPSRFQPIPNKEASTVPSQGSDVLKAPMEAPIVPSRQNDVVPVVPKNDEKQKEVKNLKTCLICMGKESKKKELICIPCKNNCQQNLVHKKCIFEWKEQLKGKGSCPLCRGRLGKIHYKPPDYLHTNALSDFYARKFFNLSPVPKKAGMVRCFLKVKNNPWWGSPFLYEFYLQKIGIKKYPHGPIPGNKSPEPGDIFLMSAKKRTQLHSFFSGLTGFNFSNNSFSLNLHSCIDVSMDHDFDRNSKNYLGNVQASSFTGLEYTVNAMIYSRHESGCASTSVTPSSKAAKVHGSPSADDLHTRSMDSAESGCSELREHSTSCSGPTLNFSLSSLSKNRNGFFGRRRQKEVTTQTEGMVQVSSEVACVHYAQNRVGAESGPRKMKISIPKLSTISRSKGTKILLGNKQLPSLKPRLSKDVGPQEAASASANVNENAELLRDEESRKNNSLFSNIEDFSSDDESDDDSDKERLHSEVTNFYRPQSGKENINRVLRRKKFSSDSHTSQPQSQDTRGLESSFLFGRNKEPYWLERIQAYSLDFNGRVTLPSNKNFQIELEKAGDNPSLPMLNGRENDDIVLQFGKVVSAVECAENVSVYTVDFKYPLSPMQALGICLSSCDRKFACA